MIIEFTAAAEAELDEAIAYYNAQRTGLGIESAQEVAASVKRIEDYPDVWQRLANGVRRCQLRRFEYGLVYRVRGNIATVYAVMHLRRRPGYWRHRMNR